MRLALLLMCCCATSQAALMDVQLIGLGDSINGDHTSTPVSVSYKLERTHDYAELSTEVIGGGDLSGYIDFSAPAYRYELWPLEPIGLGATKFYLDDLPLSVGHEVWTEPGQHRLSWQRERVDYATTGAVLSLQIPEPSGRCLALALPLLAIPLLWRVRAGSAR